MLKYKRAGFVENLSSTSRFAMQILTVCILQYSPHIVESAGYGHYHTQGTPTLAVMHAYDKGC